MWKVAAAAAAAAAAAQTEEEREHNENKKALDRSSRKPVFIEPLFHRKKTEFGSMVPPTHHITNHPKNILQESPRPARA